MLFEVPAQGCGAKNGPEVPQAPLGVFPRSGLGAAGWIKVVGIEAERMTLNQV